MKIFLSGLVCMVYPPKNPTPTTSNTQIILHVALLSMTHTIISTQNDAFCWFPVIPQSMHFRFTWDEILRVFMCQATSNLKEKTNVILSQHSSKYLGLRCFLDSFCLFVSFYHTTFSDHRRKIYFEGCIMNVWIFGWNIFYFILIKRMGQSSKANMYNPLVISI